MIVLIDNYDSFSHNLVQLLGTAAGDDPDLRVRVVRNDALSVDELAALHPTGIVLSPGPGRPADAGVCEDVVRALSGTVPILGVCLGHQAICEAFGGAIVHARELMHGKASLVMLDSDAAIFDGIRVPARVGRYHSLEADPDALPACLRVISTTLDGEVMAVQHVRDPTFGLQFHPESILTPCGARIAENFLRVCRAHGARARGR
ncbi:aminodeoxychorismate/anthranilate synthase component II [bacterium]|nr:aminodeoxychorismate/anthranilate synthase component II [bacterium]